MEQIVLKEEPVTKGYVCPAVAGFFAFRKNEREWFDGNGIDGYFVIGPVPAVYKNSGKESGSLFVRNGRGSLYCQPVIFLASSAGSSCPPAQYHDCCACDGAFVPLV